MEKRNKRKSEVRLVWFFICIFDGRLRPGLCVVLFRSRVKKRRFFSTQSQKKIKREREKKEKTRRERKLLSSSENLPLSLSLSPSLSLSLLLFPPRVFRDDAATTVFSRRRRSRFERCRILFAAQVSNETTTTKFASENQRRRRRRRR